MNDSETSQINTSAMTRILHVAGARPNFMKIAPLMSAFAEHENVHQCLVHTGQHYDDSLSEVFLRELGIPDPDIYLGVGSASHAVQTARIMMAFEPVCLTRQPHLVIVVGDVNSTVACALVASKLGIKIAHVEAGLRSFDRTMPEEINRVLTDALSDFLFTTERSANKNLRREGIPPERIHFVGNVMIDTLLRYRERVRSLNLPQKHGVEPRRYALVTLHRPANVDGATPLELIVSALKRVSGVMQVLFPVHPRTRERLEAFELTQRLGSVRVMEPLGYLDFLGLMADAAVVVTDSGGVQEETTALNVPCVTVRSNTERPVTLECGTNRLVKLDQDAIVTAILSAAAESDGTQDGIHRLPELWDGKAAQRIADIIVTALKDPTCPAL